jgi:hypothetical protein
MLAALNGFQKPSDSVQTITGTESFSSMEESCGPSRATWQGWSHHVKVNVVVPFTGAFKTWTKG